MTVGKRADDSQIRFGPYCLVASQRLLTKDGVPVPLGGRALDILICLTDRAGEVVPAGDLMRLVWQDVRAASATVTLLQKLATLPTSCSRPRSDNNTVLSVFGGLKARSRYWSSLRATAADCSFRRGGR